jgi:hypothetical protein
MHQTQRETSFQFPNLDVTYPISKKASHIRAYEIVSRAMELAVDLSQVKLNINIDLHWCDTPKPPDTFGDLNC